MRGTERARRRHGHPEDRPHGPPGAAAALPNRCPIPTAPEIRRLVADMIETMEDAGGVGLAAPQVHVPLRLFVFRVPTDRAAGDADDLPRRQHGADQPGRSSCWARSGSLRWEGCLSIPGLRAGGAARLAHPLPRGGLRGPAGGARGHRLPRRRGAARIRPPGRDSLPHAHDRLLACSASPRSWPGRPSDGREAGAAGSSAMIAPPERSAERDAALQAMLPHVPSTGWTFAALRGAPARRSARSARGGRTAVPRRRGRHDRGVLRSGRPADGAGGGGAGSRRACACPARVRAVVALRLAQNRPYKEAVRRAVAVLALPRARRAGGGAARRARWTRSGTPRATARRISPGTPSGRSWPRYTARRCCSGCAMRARTTRRRWPSSTAGCRVWRA